VTASPGYASEILWEDGEFVLCRGTWNGEALPLLATMPSSAQPSAETLARLQHAYAVREELDPAWAARPLRLQLHQGRLTLFSEDPGGEPLLRLLTRPLEINAFLRFAVGIASALAQVHRRGLIHKDIKPANVLVSSGTGQVWLTGFGIASRLPRERQPPAPPEVIAGTLAYMAPEQTGRMNRSIDSRSDLYALGVTLYEALTGEPPFAASHPMEWVHCHIARQPAPPDERVASIPGPLSAIVMKLLAKNAEDRYQTAAGLAVDLRKCLAEWESHGDIQPFLLGADDASDRLIVPEKLYGREHEIEMLRGAFDRVVANGATELVLVSGYAGIGKSSVVNELQKALVPPRGLFASGKFDQYQRDIPYGTLAQAFRGLVRPLLGEGETELDRWRDSLGEALGPNGQLIVNLIPELELVIGAQPPVADLPPQDAKNRFQTVFRRFIRVFARKEHPLTLFLDDLQWLDAATLDLIEHMVTHSEVRHLLLVGAYRDNEVDPTHPLIQRFDAIRNAGARVEEIVLTPLGLDDIARLVTDAVHCELERARPLAQLVHEKTGGNPFFAIQFISALAEEGLVRFDHDAGHWRWELDRLRAKGYTDNVVDLMAGKLTRLPVETQAALQQLACLGNGTEITMLSVILGKSNEDVRSDLWHAVRLELVQHVEGSYKFIHDRVREAAYSLIPERLRGEAHLRVGRRLAADTPAEKREEAIFEIVNQLNRGAALITSRDERDQLAEFNLVAAKRAKASTAYASALAYLVAGATLVAEDCWERQHELMFALELARAECEFLTGNLPAAELRLNTLLSRATTTVERAIVVCLFLDLYTARGQNACAIDVALDFLQPLGVDLPRHPTEEDVRREYGHICSQLDGLTVEDWLAFPLMVDPTFLALIDVLMKIQPPAYFAEPNLWCLSIIRILQLSLEKGNSDASIAAYVALGLIAAQRSDYKSAFRFGEISYQVTERLPKTRFRAAVHMNFGASLVPYARHFREGRDLLRRAFEIANTNGDLIFAGYSCAKLIENLLVGGESLAEAQREAEHVFEFVQKTGFRYVIDWIAAQLGFIRTLRGSTPRFGCLNYEQFDEREIERRFFADQQQMRTQSRYWICKLEARFFAGNYADALDASGKMHEFIWSLPSLPQASEYHFYSALARAASCQSETTEDRAQHIEALVAHHRELQGYAFSCPENFAHCAALVGAEIARIEGRDVDAMRLYEHAICAAAANGFIHQEALAKEFAARFYAARNFEKIARVYLQDARYSYLWWGADGKVRQLDERYPHLQEERALSSGAATIGAPVAQLDVETVVKASQAVSGEIVLENLIKTLMVIAVEHAGAERGLLILPRGDQLWVEAEAVTGLKTVEVKLRQALVAPSELPLSILQYVIRIQEAVISDDASKEKPFSADEYVASGRVRSVLCLPLIKQAKLVGLLYLENSVATSVFTPARIGLLKLLASQAAISFDNARLYGELTMTEERWRKLFESVPVGVGLIGSHRRYVATNPAFQKMTGYTEVELRQLSPIDITYEDDQAVTDAISAANAAGDARRIEKRYRRKDGGVTWAEVGAFLAPGTGSEPFLAAVAIDITERKLAEEALKDARADLERMARLTTMGELSASIAHEINQPLAAIVTQSEAALRFLDWDEPNLDEARHALSCIARDGLRASDVIRGLRALAKKSGPQLTKLDIDHVIMEVLALAGGELRRHNVVLRTALATGDHPVMGDRGQLQQVLLNLIMNGAQAMNEVAERARELKVSTTLADPGSVLISVEDTGAGLDPVVAERMFQPFFTTKRDGLGMGLAICRSIVESHGGRLWASPRAPYGADVRFTVPVWTES
jgi:PAS domain S-box-containing protein